MEDGKQALISITSCVHGDGQQAAQEDTVHLLTSGIFCEQDGGFLLCYDEVLDENTPAQHVTLRFLDDSVSMDREGDYQSSLVFCRGMRYEGLYRTPFGDMDMAVYCTKLNYSVDDVGGEMVLQYQLDLGGQFVAMRDMQLKFSLRENG